MAFGEDKILIIFLTTLIVQRIHELFLAKRNTRISLLKGGKVFKEKIFIYIVVLHILFLMFIPLESIFFAYGNLSFSFTEKINYPIQWQTELFLLIWILIQGLRYWTITTLGFNWNTKIVVIPNVAPTHTGPYKFLKHPNYLVVILEFLIVPIIFASYITGTAAFLINLLLLKKRIKFEEEILSSNSNYEEVFKSQKKIIPFKLGKD